MSEGGVINFNQYGAAKAKVDQICDRWVYLTLLDGPYRGTHHIRTLEELQ